MLTDEIIDLMKTKGTYHVPTSYLAEAIDLDNLPPQIRAKAESILPLARESLKKSIAAGVKIAFGTDAAVFPHGENAKEFEVYVRMGMAPVDAIRTSTLNAADLLGVSDRGILKSGQLADIIGVNGDPLQDITLLENVDFVMKGGRVYKQGE
jgi:imidazolonepropionase-like amidohydrolase